MNADPIFKKSARNKHPKYHIGHPSSVDIHQKSRGPRKKEIAPALHTLVPGSWVHFLLEISYPLRPMTFIQGILSLLQDQKKNIKRGPELREFCLPRWKSEEGIRISLLLVLSRMFLNGEI